MFVDSIAELLTDDDEFLIFLIKNCNIVQVRVRTQHSSERILSPESVRNRMIQGSILDSSTLDSLVCIFFASPKSMRKELGERAS